MLEYDLVNLKAKIKTESLSKLKFLKEDPTNVYLEDFAKFSNWFIDGRHLREHFEKPSTASEEINEEFIDTLLEFFELRHSNQGRYGAFIFQMKIEEIVIVEILVFSVKYMRILKFNYFSIQKFKFILLNLVIS